MMANVLLCLNVDETYMSGQIPSIMHMEQFVKELDKSCSILDFMFVGRPLLGISPHFLNKQKSKSYCLDY